MLEVRDLTTAYAGLVAISGKRDRLPVARDQVVQQVANARVVFGDDHPHSLEP